MEILIITLVFIIIFMFGSNIKSDDTEYVGGNFYTKKDSKNKKKMCPPPPPPRSRKLREGGMPPKPKY